jgi:peroxiredoxin
MSAVLWLAAVYNILWATTNIALPTMVFEQVEMTPPTPIEFWLGLNALVGVFGVGYAIAATAPFKHWAVVAMGLLSKLAATAGMAVAVFATKTLPLKFGYLTIVNDVIWLVPLALVLHGAWRARHPKAKPAKIAPTAPGREAAAHAAADPSHASASTTAGEPATTAYQAAESAALATATRQATLHRGHMLSALSLRELSDKTPTLVVFLRHLGCPFCRQTLAEIVQQRKAIEAKGIAIVLVHQSHPLKAAKFFEKFGLDEPEQIWHISDPERRLYATFELARGKLGQLLGFRELTQGFKFAILKGRFFGLPQGDSKQLGGAFLFYRRRILKAFRSTRASDRPDCSDVAACTIELAPAGPATTPVGPVSTSQGRR